MAEYFTKDGDNYVKVESQLHTQEDLDRVVTDRLDRERKKFGDYEELKGKVTTLTKELEDSKTSWGTEKSELEGKLKKAILETEKVKIISEFKLSDELAEFVEADTAEDMRKRAEKLAKGIKPGAINIDKEEKPDEKGNHSKVIAGKLFGKKSDD